MQFTTTFLLAAIAAMATTVIAVPNAESAHAIYKRDNCKKGLNYCGRGLMRKGKYGPQIADQMWVNRLDGRSDDVLFHCEGGSKGDITVTAVCGKCIDGGSGRSDFCLLRSDGSIN